MKIKGQHEAVKTKEQHDFIINKFESTRLVPSLSKKGEYVLSSLVKCGHCGRGFSLFTKATNKKTFLKKCRHILPNGFDRCDKNMGVAEKIVVEAVMNDTKQYSKELFSKEAVPIVEIDESLSAVIETTKKDIEKSKERIVRITDLYIDAMISKEDHATRKKAEEMKLRRLQIDLEAYEDELRMKSPIDVEARRKVWESVDLENVFDTLSIIEKNEVLKRLIKRIEYKRQGDELELNIVYN